MFKWLYRVVFTLILLLFLVIGVFFAIRNPQPMSLDLVFWQAPEFSVALYLILAFAFGAIVALTASSVALLGSERKIKVLGKRLEKNQLELDAVRKESITKELVVNEE